MRFPRSLWHSGGVGLAGHRPVVNNAIAGLPASAAPVHAAALPQSAGAVPTGTGEPGRSPLLALALVTFCIYLGWGIVSPVLPLYASSFGVGSFDVGVLVASFSVTSLAFDLYGGRLSDRYGARRMACGGAVLVALTSVVAGAAPSFGILLLARALTGVGSALYVTAAMNVLARTTSPDRMARSMSYYQAAVMSGVAFGPSIGGLIAHLSNYRVPLYCYAGMAALCAAVSLFTLPAKLPAPIRRGDSGDTGRLLRDGAFCTALALAAAVFVVRAGVLSTLVPLFAHERLGLSASAIGFALTVSALVNLLVLPHAGRLADRTHRKVAVLIGLIAGLAGLLVLILPAGVVLLYVGMIALGICTGYAGVSPAAIIADVAPAGRSGMAMGMYRMGVDFGSVAGPLVAGQMAAASSYRASFLVMALPLALMMVLALRLRDTRIR